MRNAKIIYEEAKTEVLNDNNQSLNSMAIIGIEKAQKEMFYYLYQEAEKNENKDLSIIDFFDKLERILDFSYIDNPVIPTSEPKEFGKIKTTLLKLVNAIEKREIEVYTTTNGITISRLDEFLEMEKKELIEAHSDGIRFIAENTTTPQPASISWFRQKYDVLHRNELYKR